MTPPLHRLEITVPAAALEAFEDALAPFVSALSAEADADARQWRLSGYCAALPDHTALRARLYETASVLGLPIPEPRLDALPETDWVTDNLRSFPPVRAGRYFIHGGHHAAPAPAGAIAVRIDAGAAFGTGSHGSTAGCLEALGYILARRRPPRAPRRILDLGCGAGVLAIAAAKTAKRPVLAADIDPTAVRVARENARLNGVHTLVRCVHENGVGPAVRARAPFDLICANILSGPLMKMAADIAGVTAPRGSVVLSGLLTREAPAVETRCRQAGLRRVRRITREGWTTLVMEKAAGVFC
ncbi:MAG: 50S ribosomal protein L11 methyltransferase [Rhodospirillales bacterium]